MGFNLNQEFNIRLDCRSLV